MFKYWKRKNVYFPIASDDFFKQNKIDTLFWVFKFWSLTGYKKVWKSEGKRIKK